MIKKEIIVCKNCGSRNIEIRDNSYYFCLDCNQKTIGNSILIDCGEDKKHAE